MSVSPASDNSERRKSCRSIVPSWPLRASLSSSVLMLGYCVSPWWLSAHRLRRGEPDSVLLHRRLPGGDGVQARSGVKPGPAPSLRSARRPASAPPAGADFLRKHHQASAPCARLADALSARILGCLPAVAGDFVVAPMTIDETKAVFGQVESRDTVPARARIGGTVREIAVEEGEHGRRRRVSSRSCVDDKLALQRDAADADIKALIVRARERTHRARPRRSSSSPRAPTPQSRVDQAADHGRCARQPARCGDRPRRAVIVQQTSRGRGARPRVGPRAVGAGRPGLRRHGRRDDRPHRRRRLLPAPGAARAACRRDPRRRQGQRRHVACVSAPTAAPADSQDGQARQGLSRDRATAASSPMSRSTVSATISSASGRWSGCRSAERSVARGAARGGRPPVTASTIVSVVGEAGPRRRRRRPRRQSAPTAAGSRC